MVIHKSAHLGAPVRRARSIVSRSRPLLASVILGLVVAGVCEATLPGLSYRAHALIGDDQGAPGAGPDLSHLVSNPVPKPVLARAGAALREQGITANQPGLFERLAVAADFAMATNQDERLAESLSSRVTIAPGPTGGALAIEARDEKPARAATLATAVATAYVVEQNEAAATARRAADAAIASRLQGLVEAVDSARHTLQSFGAAATDPAEARADLALATARAKTRLEAFRAVMASGSPPLGAQAGLPPTVMPLQSDYLDLKRQLLDAQRTLGERHMTVIALQDGLRQSAKNLTAEWKRLTQGAEVDWVAARDHEGAVARADAARDPKTRLAVTQARETLRDSEDAMRRFRSSLGIPTDEPRLHLIAPAMAPALADGFSDGMRLLLAILSGLAAAALLSLASLHRAKGANRDQVSIEPTLAQADPVAHPRVDQADPVAHPRVDQAERVESGLDRPLPLREVHRAMGEPRHEVPSARRAPIVPSDRPKPMERSASPRKSAPVKAPGGSRRDDLLAALADIVPALIRLSPDKGATPTVFVGSLEGASVTSPVALGLARAAAEAGQRVLLIEGERPRPLLAAAIDRDAQPVLVDVLGTLKIALRDEIDGLLYLAPAFSDAKRLVAGLARRDDVPFIDDVGTAFDLTIVDGGTVDRQKTGDWASIADATLRVARFASKRDDEAFLDAVGGTFASFLGTIAASASAPPSEIAPSPEVVSRTPRNDVAAVSRSVFVPRLVEDPTPAASKPASVRATHARRRVGAR